MLTDVLLLLIGISSGFLIAASLFALFTSLGILSRLSDKTHTKRAAHIYENCILAGGSLCNILIVYKINSYEFFKDLLPDSVIFVISILCLLTIGIFFGIYVGCLAMSLAEVLKVSVVFSRRFRIHKGIGYVNVFLALGKCSGSLFYFFRNLF